MKDTPAPVRQLQLELFQRMTPGQRIQVCLQMIDDGRKLVEGRIRADHPEWSTGQVVAAVCEELYRQEFSGEELAQIKQSIISYHQNK
ncbi:hypothetical protein GCM10023189_20800 [Nibrella saemangeumensis]|uniref:Uncharacterized protein n=1 Tax=Nibrella saemangeumensis TaxID=1084526 RepID=A0ABP8MU61_9BACT